MQRTNSTSARDDRDPGLGEEERDSLLSRSGSGTNTPDLEASRGTKRGRQGWLGQRGGKRRNSNDGGIPYYNRTFSPKERVQQKKLCLILPLLLIPLTIVLLLMTHVFHVSWIHDPSSDQPPSTSPNDGPQHVPIPVNGPFKLPPPTNVRRNDAFYTQGEHGMVAAEEEGCSRMGVEILKKGGNAVDAAITSCLCIGTVNSFSSGIGGGGFMLIRAPGKARTSLVGGGELSWSTSSTYLNPENSPFLINITSPSASSSDNSTLIAIDFRETAPSLSSPSMYVTAPPGSSQVGGLSVGVPGEVRGLYTAWEMYGSGRVEWKDLVEPVAELAKGWRVGRELARRFRIYGNFMDGKDEWLSVFRPNQSPMLVEGDFISRHNYSLALSAVAEHGPSVFYGHPDGKDDSGNGDAWIAKNMIETIKKSGGIMTREDLRDYKVRVYEPLKTVYNGNTIWTTDAPSCGPVMLGMFNILESYDLHSQAQKNATRTGLNMHRLTEAMKFAFGARTEISDPDKAFMDKARRERVVGFGKKEWAESVLRNLTDDKTHTPDYYNPIFDVLTDSGTTSLSVADQWGGAVSITSTVNLIFGSRVMDRNTGIILNDEMDDFSTPGKVNAFGLKPSPYNYPEPGKRPLSSTAATIVERPDGSLYAALGGSGGSRIFGAVTQVLLNIEWGMDVTNAVEAPRLHDQLFPTTVTIETAFGDEMVESLKSRGHNVTMFDINLGVAEVQAVVLHENGTFSGASDSRKNGRAWGF